MNGIQFFLLAFTNTSIVFDTFIIFTSFFTNKMYTFALRNNNKISNQMSKKKEKSSVKAEEPIDAIKALRIEKKQVRKRLYRLILFIPIALSSSMAALILAISNPEDKKYTEKVPIKEVMRNTIKNGGELSSIKHIYNTRNIENVFFYNPFSDKRKNFYTDDYPLSGILNDLLVDYLQDSKDKDSVYYVALCHIIAENEKQNPFDNLEENQKYSFESIQVKLDSTYTKISPDVIKIAEELNSKNQLVNKYLNKSDISFYISIAALIITILFSAFQIYQNYSTYKGLRKFITKSSDEESSERNEE